MPPEGYVVSFMSGDLQYLRIDSFGGCWITMRWSCSILLPTGFNIWRRLLPYVRVSGDRSPFSFVAVFLYRQFVEEEDWGEGCERADGMRQCSSVPYPVEGLPVHASGDI